jgi:hypothetical protein
MSNLYKFKNGLQAPVIKGKGNGHVSLTYYGTLADALTGIGSEEISLVIDDDSSENVTIPANIKLVAGGGLLSGTVTVNGEIEDSMSQIFNGATLTLGSNVSFVRPEWFGAVGDGVTDDEAAFNAALTACDGAYMGNSVNFSSLNPDGKTFLLSAKEYCIQDTLYVPSCTTVKGTGWGSKIRFAPTSGTPSLFEPLNIYFGTGASTLRKSNHNMRFRDFFCCTNATGGTIPGYGGSGTVTEYNTFALHCFNIYDSEATEINNVLVTNFFQGTAFKIQDLNTVFSYYNQIVNCQTRDCQCDFDVNNACSVINLNAGENNTFPADALGKDYMGIINGSGVNVSGGSYEGHPQIAIFEDKASGTFIGGAYLECFNSSAFVDASSQVNNAGSGLYAGNHHGFTYNTIVNENMTKSGAFNFTQGINISTGNCKELKISQSSTKQSPSFRWGVNGGTHFPSNGNLDTIEDSFIDISCLQLQRTAATSGGDNTFVYNFKVDGDWSFDANIWLTVLVKIEGGEDNWELFTFDSNNGTSNFEKLMTFDNGWVMYGTYFNHNPRQTYTFNIKQLTGSTDTSRKVKFTCLRAYCNGYKPIPGIYEWDERKSTVPTAGLWVLGDKVFNSNPSAGGEIGWMCVDDLDTDLDGAAIATDTIITVTDATGVTTSHECGVKLDDGTWHFSSVTNVSGTDITISAMPGDAADENRVYFFQFQSMGTLS